MGYAAGRNTRVSKPVPDSQVEKRDLISMLFCDTTAYYLRRALGADPEECITFTDKRVFDGYSITTVNGKKVGAHRVVWALHNKKDVPHGLVVCHACDNKKCINPHHLFVDTQSGNIIDFKMKERCDTRNVDSIEKEEILQIRAQFNKGSLPFVIAKQHDITPSDVHYIVTKDDWPWLL